MGRDDYTDIGGTGEAFLTTHWSLIERVGSAEEARDCALIGLLMNRYWKPVYCFIRRKGHDNERAKDLTQGFFHEVVLERNLIERADASKGRFRSFLLTALDRYLANARDSQTAQKRTPRGRLVSLDMVEPAQLPESLANLAPEDTFHYAWISALLERVLKDVEARCREEGRTVHWQIFHDRVLSPIMERGDPPPLGEICTRYGIDSEAKASNMIVTVKRRFQAALRQQLRSSVVSDACVQGEVEEIRRFFPKIAQETN